MRFFLSVRQLALAAIWVTAIPSCRSDRATWSPVTDRVPPGFAMPAAHKEQARAAVAEWNNHDRARPVLLGPQATARVCQAGDRYRAALELLEPHVDALALDRQLWRPEKWSEADPAITELLDSPFATSVAEAVIAGAACQDGRVDGVFMPWADVPLVPYLHLAQTADMIGLRWADQGRTLDAAYLLVAVMQLGFDLARNGDLVHLELGWRVAGYPLAPLDAIAARLDADGLDQISEACRMVIDSAPSFATILRGERIAATELALWAASGGMAGAREDPDGRKTLDRLAAIGGTAGYLDRFDQMLDGVDALEQQPLPDALDQLTRIIESSGWPGGFFDVASYLAKHRVGLAVARAHQVALAVRARKLRAGDWPADLGFLGDLADDPRTGKPFGYAPGEAIRGVPVDCGERKDCNSDALTVSLQ